MWLKQNLLHRASARTARAARRNPVRQCAALLIKLAVVVKSVSKPYGCSWLCFWAWSFKNSKEVIQSGKSWRQEGVSCDIMWKDWNCLKSQLEITDYMVMRNPSNRPLESYGEMVQKFGTGAALAEHCTLVPVSGGLEQTFIWDLLQADREPSSQLWIVRLPLASKPIPLQEHRLLSHLSLSLWPLNCTI